MKDKYMIAVLAVAVGAIALSCHMFGVCGAKAETPQAVEAVAVENAGAETTLKTVSFDVPGMTCVTCPYTVKKTLQKIDGVTEADSAFETMSATATFDPAKTSIDVMLEALKNQGYPSTVAEATCEDAETAEC